MGDEFDEELAQYEAARADRAAGLPDGGDNNASDAKLNAIVKSQLKRMQKSIIAELSKTLGDKLATAGATSPTGEGGDHAMREELAAARRELAEAKQTAQREKVHQEARAILAAKGIAGVRAEAVIALVERDGRLALDDDGQATIAVSRSRTKGGQVEEMIFDDLAAGLDDWAKSEEASHFLPAPGAGKTRQIQRPALRRVEQPRDPNYLPTEDECARNAHADLGDALSRLIDE